MSRYLLRTDRDQLPLEHGEITIGRSVGCNLRLGGALVSRRHARLRLDRAGLHIEDLGSRNGIRINGRLLRQPRLLRHGDQITIGLEVLTLMDTTMMELPESATTLPPPLSPLEDVEEHELTTAAARLGKLSERERDVYELILQGHTLREIGKRLYLSVKTIETYRTRIGEKMGCRSRAELVHAAVTAGMLGAPALPVEHRSSPH